MPIHAETQQSDSAQTWTVEQQLGTGAKSRGDYSGAESHFKAALEISKSFAPNDGRIAETLTEQAAILVQRGLYAQAEPLLRRALAIQEIASGLDSLPAASARNNLGAAQQQLGHLDEAQVLIGAALATAQHAFAPEDVRLVPFLTHRAAVYAARKDFAAAEKLLTQALANSQQAGHKQLEAQAWTYLGELYQVQSAQGKAETAFTRALAIYEASNFPVLETARALNNLAVLLANGHFYTAGLTHAVRAVETCSKIGPVDSATCGSSLSTLASIEISLGKNASAELHALQAVDILKRTAGPESRLLAAATNNLGQAYAGESRYKDAEQALMEAADICKKSTGAAHPQYASALANLGAIFVMQKRYKNAEDLYRKAAEIDRVALGEKSAKYADDLNRLGVLLIAEKHKSEAEEALRNAIAIETGALGQDSPAMADPALNLASLLHSENRREEALEYYRMGFRLRAAANGNSDPRVAAALNNYASLLKEMQLWAEAEQVSTEALGLQVQQAIHPDSYR